MRGEERCVTGGAPRSTGRGEAAGRKESVQNFSCKTTKFGWVFPPTKTRQQGVINAVWLREFAREIEILQSEIKKQTALISGNEKLNHQKDGLQTDYHSECCATTMNCKDRVSAPEKTAGSRVSVSSSVNMHSLESRDVICRKLASGKTNLGMCCSSQGPAKVKVNVQEPTQLVECSRSEKSFVLDSRMNTYAGGAKCDEYSSMQSDISRDSGMFSVDDTSIVSEVSEDKSLLQEIGDVLGDQEVSLESCIHCGSLPLDEIMPVTKDNANCPVWMTRFSSSKDLSTEWGSQEWSSGHSPFNCISPVTRRKNCASESRDSHFTPPAAVSHEENGLKVKQCVTCEKLNEESPLSHTALKEISELAKFTHSFRGLSTRVEDLRSELESLAGEVNDSMRDFISLEERTARLLASTVTSRHRLTRVRALQLLEDRLQEEWWAAYDPNGVSFHENYIV